MLNLLSTQDVQLLETHLQAIVEVEMFTVPLYLTAVYSFTDKALNYSETSADGKTTTPLYDLQQKTLSVAVQEMYHMQLACNLANAFQVTPQLPQLDVAAKGELTIPHLDPKGKKLTTKLGNLPQLIEAMIAVETPDPDPQFPVPNATATYHSISDLYHATLQLLSKYLEAARSTPHALDPHFTPDNKQIAAHTFIERYTYNTVSSRNDVVELANAITDQGEGKPVSTPANSHVAKFFAVASPGNSDDSDAVDPKYQPKPGSRFAQYDDRTHYSRFLDIQSVLANKDWAKLIGGPVFYEANGKQLDFPKWAEQNKLDFDTLQTSMNTIWTYLIQVIQTAVNDGELHPPTPSPYPAFADAMISFKYLIPLIWQTGYCPSFIYAPQGQQPVTGEQAQAAMDKVDPLCLFHWDAASNVVRNDFPKNACQGLNQCKGQGWGGIGTQPGDGACATADFHTCQGGNSCEYQGGCGFLSGNLPDTEQWIPGENSKTPKGKGGTGGCQTPIALGAQPPAGDQVFDRTATINPAWSPQIKARLEGLKGKSVWDEARNLFAKRHKLQSAADLPAPQAKQQDGINYDGNARRQAIAATSK